MTVDIAKLHALLDAVPCAEGWTYGGVSGIIETSQRANNGDIYGRTCFVPDDQDQREYDDRATESVIAEAALAVAAVNALPELSAEVEVWRAAIKAARTALSSNGHCGEGSLAEMIARALTEARQAGRDEMHEVARALMDADRAFDGALTRDWTGAIAERVRPLVAVYEAASAHVDKFRHTHDPLQGAAQLFDAVDAARKTGA